MTARQIRRTAEHKARKDAYKAQKQAEREGTPPMATPEPAPIPTRAALNRANAQDEPAILREAKTPGRSTGPRTEIGKAISSQNAVRHGLSSSKFLVMEWENYDDFLDLLYNLRAEHQPQTQTEALLIEKMAEHFWLAQRALRLQDMCFKVNLPLCEQPKDLALYLRYQTTHERAFHKCLSDLLKLRAAQRKAESDFVSQQHKQAAETRKQELHEARLPSVKPKKIHSKPIPTSTPTHIPMPLTNPAAPASLIADPENHVLHAA